MWHRRPALENIATQLDELGKNVSLAVQMRTTSLLELRYQTHIRVLRDWECVDKVLLMQTTNKLR